ncbi:MAG: hypothetical protein QW197_03575 [Candidatus Aenigmatarchaeota archaeon]
MTAEEKIILEQLEEDWKYLVLAGAGAGLSDLVVDYVKKFLPVSLADPVLKIGVGYLLNRFVAPRFMPEYLSAFSNGVMIAGFAELVKQFVAGGLGGLLSKPQPQTQAPTGGIEAIIV